MTNDTEQLTLTEFLTAMLDKDAAAWRQSSEFLVAHPGLAHLSRYMLADIAAKRAIIERYADSKAWGEQGHYDEYASESCGLETALTLLASVYADHPDCREEWRP